MNMEVKNKYFMLKRLTLLLAAFYSGPIFASDTIWELGAGLAAINLPLYAGSDESKNYVIPFPYVRIKSKYLEIDDGIRGFLFESPDLRINISADFGIPVNSEDSDVRTGMEDLNTVIQVGPSLEMIFAGGRKQAFEFRLEVPVRLAIATDIKQTENVGWIVEPRLTYETLRPFKKGWAYEVSGGIKYASKEYHQYYYDVTAPFVTANRAFFAADKGYSGFFLDLVGSWREKEMFYFATVRYQNLSSTVFEGSPLLEDSNYISVGLGVVWFFADSL